MDAESTTLLVPYHAYGATHSSTATGTNTGLVPAGSGVRTSTPGALPRRLAEGARAIFSHGGVAQNTAVKYDGEQERRVVAVQLTEG